MILKIKNFEIEDDRNCFILRTYGNKVNKQTKETTYWIVDEIYPVSLEECFKKMLNRSKLYDQEVISDLKKYMDKVETMEKELLEEFRTTLRVAKFIS